MSADDRYLWGTTKSDRIRVMEHVILTGQSSPPDAEEGILYRDASTGKLKLCADGTNYETVTSA
jgi:hypothetical protein